MAREKINKLLEESKKNIEQDHKIFENEIIQDLKTFKKKTLDQI